MKSANGGVIIFLMTLANACISEQRIQRSDLPAAVQKAVDTESAGVVVIGYSSAVKKGKVEYEVQLMAGSHTKDVMMDPQGNVLEIEEEFAVSALPVSVLHGLSSRAGKGNIVKVESLTKHGEIVAYEAQVVTGGKRSEIQVGPDGRRLRHEK